MQQLLPERVPMLEAAMLEQFLAMVRREDHQARLQHAAVGEPVTQDTELRVHIGDLFIVGGDDERPVRWQQVLDSAPLSSCVSGA